MKVKACQNNHLGTNIFLKWRKWEFWCIVIAKVFVTKYDQTKKDWCSWYNSRASLAQCMIKILLIKVALTSKSNSTLHYTILVARLFTDEEQYLSTKSRVLRGLAGILGVLRGPLPRFYLHAFQLLFTFDLQDFSHFTWLLVFLFIHLGSLRKVETTNFAVTGVLQKKTLH